MNDAADIVVVGAGVMGASVAFQLATAGAQRVTVVDQTHVAGGMTARSSAVVRMHYTLPAEVALALTSRELFLRWPELTGRPSPLRQVGFVRIVPPADRERLLANVDMLRALGARVELVDGGRLKELEPDWVTDDVTVAAYEAGSGYGDAAVVATDLLDAARALGVEYRPGTASVEILRRDGRVTGIETSTGALGARVVVVAAGVWAPRLLAPIDVDAPIELEYHETVFLTNPPGMRAEGASCIDPINGVYFRSERPAMTLVGAFHVHEDGPRITDPDKLPERADPERVTQLVGAAAGRIPALADAGIFRSVTGLYDISPDSRPIIGWAPEVEGLMVVGGFSGMGFKISPAVGKGVAEMILGVPEPAVDLSPFTPRRFAEGTLIRAPNEYQG